MKPENLTALPPTCERAKELGWSRPTYFICYRGKIKPIEHMEIAGNFHFGELPISFAPTLAEVLQELPDEIYHHEKRFVLSLFPDGRKYLMRYHSGYDCVGLEIDKNPAEASLKLWIWLKENGHLGEKS